MTTQNHQQLGKTLWNIADTLRGAMNADDFRDYMLAFLFLRYLSDNYEAAAKRNSAGTIPLSQRAITACHWRSGMPTTPATWWTSISRCGARSTMSSSRITSGPISPTLPAARAIILPHGVLFRGDAEERIRTKLLQDGHIDTVIGLPALP